MTGDRVAGRAVLGLLEPLGPQLAETPQTHGTYQWGRAARSLLDGSRSVTMDNKDGM
ncbi:MAG: hypothetical protein ACRDTF_13990 [Pseudonocardiaceae bacterium]